VGERHLQRDGEQIARRELVLVDADWDHGDAQHLAREECVRTNIFRRHRVLAPADELGANLVGEDVLHLEERAAILELWNADRVDRRRQERTAAGEGVAAAARRGSVRREHNGGQPAHAYFTTMDTSRPLATTTFTTVLPAVYVAT